jgi:UDP-2-acetamido-3-amino-2,3-dideoxy-glucuronate N-acetyltransferase
MASPKRVALAGAGGWSRNIARNLGRLRGAVFAAVCDTDPHALAALDGTPPSVRWVEDFAGLIADPEIDAVVVATPPETHHGLAASPIRSGKDVLVEKPLTLDPGDAEDLVRLAREHSPF